MTENTNQESLNNCPYCDTELAPGEFFCRSENCGSPASLLQNTQTTGSPVTDQRKHAEKYPDKQTTSEKETRNNSERKAPELSKIKNKNIYSSTNTSESRKRSSTKLSTVNPATIKTGQKNLAVSKKLKSTTDTFGKVKTKNKNKSQQSKLSVPKKGPWKNYKIHDHIVKAKSTQTSIPLLLLLLLLTASLSTMSIALDKTSTEIIIFFIFMTVIIFLKLTATIFKLIAPNDSDLEWDKYTSWLFDETSSVVVAITISVKSDKKIPYYVTVSLADQEKNAVHKGLHVVYSNYDYKKHIPELYGTNEIEKKNSPIKRVAKCYWEPKYDPKTMVIELEDLLLFCRERDL